MELSGNTILITGGATGIGRAFADRFHAAGSKVIVCGRREEALRDAEAAGLLTIQADVSRESDRLALLEQVKSNFPSLNVLINNAGIQNRPPSFLEPQDWNAHRAEIATNLEAPLHLAMLFGPLLAQTKPSYLINVTSGLAFVPISFMPTYCLTKAALHSLTQTLRKQFEGKIEVIEVAPPAVQTDLGGVGLHTFGEPLDAFADHVMTKLVAGDLEFGYKSSQDRLTANYEERQAAFDAMHAPRH